MAEKELYAIGEIPPLGFVPKKMHAYVIHPEHHGPPLQAMKREVVDVPNIRPDEVLVQVMTAGVNYNGVWASLGQPASPTRFHKHPFHIAGSDAAGVIWKLGSAVKSAAYPWKVGDEVVVHCGLTCGQCHNCNGGDPMLCREQKIWGYETPYGSFAQFTTAQVQQLVPKPPNLTWEESGCYMLVLATAWRMLYGHPPHTLQPGMNVLVWGGSGGLGAMAIQICRAAGATAIAVVSSDERGKWCLEYGAKGYINRKNFNCWGQLPPVSDQEAYGFYTKEVRKFGQAIWDITGKGVDPDIVFEHPGEQTFPVSCFVARRGGMVVFCAGTTGFNLTFDASYVWMRQKRLQGSHFATMYQADAANHAVMNGHIKPAMSSVFEWERIPEAHDLMLNNLHPSGNMALMVQAPRRGVRTLAELT
jgi:crotonyl-CoA carboxylase/reductase